MAHRLSSRLTSLLLRHRTSTTTTTLHHHYATTTTTLHRHYTTASTSLLHLHPNLPFPARFLSTRPPRRAKRPDIAARARQIQSRRLWAYTAAFGSVAVVVVIVLTQLKDQLEFYITPSQALEKYSEDPSSKAKFRLGGLILEGSVAQIATSSEMQFVVTDLLADVLVKYEGSVPDLFREGHSAVVQGVIKPYTEAMKEKDAASLGKRTLEVTEKAMGLDFYLEAMEVLAKHDEKYMPQEIATAIEKNKKMLAKEDKEKKAAAVAATTAST